MIIKISQQQVQKQVLSQVMQQSMEVLQLPIMELNAHIAQELQSNPMLEASNMEGENSQTKSIEEEILDRIGKINPAHCSSQYTNDNADDERPDELPIQRNETLEDRLLKQAHIEFDNPLQVKIAEFIIGNLDENGYLKVTIEEISDFFGCNDWEFIESILTTIRSFEPIGVGARTLKECLLAQVPVKCNGNSELIAKIINEHLGNLAKKNLKAISKKLKVPLEEIRKAMLLIATLEPKPARNFRPLQSNIYIKPDITITYHEDSGYKLHINREGIPTLKINAFYRKLLYQNTLKKEEKEFIREKLKNAIHFIKCIEQRGVTIRQIAEYILDKQKGFFEKGSQHLVPLKLKDVAIALDRNESTISRAISAKYIDTPQGLYPLKYFFSHAVAENGNGKHQNGSYNGSIASRSIKEEIKDLIAAENAAKPLSDQEIQKHFDIKGIKLARRTIAKYRNNLRILPSYLRKN